MIEKFLGRSKRGYFALDLSTFHEQPAIEEHASDEWNTAGRVGTPWLKQLCFEALPDSQVVENSVDFEFVCSRTV
jgi:hypothetical protein